MPPRQTVPKHVTFLCVCALVKRKRCHVRMYGNVLYVGVDKGLFLYHFIPHCFYYHQPVGQDNAKRIAVQAAFLFLT